jgi:hypothetical protein
VNQNSDLQRERGYFLPLPVIIDDKRMNYNYAQPDFNLIFSFHYSGGPLAVGGPVNISALANVSEKWSNITKITIYFDNSMQFPIKYDDVDVMKPPNISLKRVPVLNEFPEKRNVLAGKNIVVWRTEGKYRPNIIIETEDCSNGTCFPSKYIGHTSPDGLITVYPITELIQINTNMAILLLTIPMVIVTFMEFIKIIYSLIIWAFAEKENENRYRHDKTTTNAKPIYNVTNNTADNMTINDTQKTYR